MKVFISYRRADDPSGAGRLFDHLEARFGKGNVFLDVDSSMPLGIDFREYITARIAKTDAVLVVIGPEWLRIIQEKATDPRDFVRLEIEAALECGKPVIPVLMGAPVPEEETLPPSIAKLAYLNGMPVDVGGDFRHHVEKLCSKLESSVVVSPAIKRKENAPVLPKRTKEAKPIKIVPTSGKIGWKDIATQIAGAYVGAFVFSFGGLGAAGGAGLVAAVAGLAGLAGLVAVDVLGAIHVDDDVVVVVGLALGIFFACRIRRLGRATTARAVVGGVILGFIGILISAWWNNRSSSAGKKVE